MRRMAALAFLGGVVLGWTGIAQGQEARVKDLTVAGHEIPVRLMGYGLVVGLDGSGDRVIGGFSSGHTVRSVANLLRRFDVEVPEAVLRTRNVAAVLVTAEVSPYLRPGARFEVHVSSVGDAASLRGGVLWITPLVPEVEAEPVATAQGPILMSEGGDGTPGRYYTVETAGRIPDGGVLERSLPTPPFGETTVLYLKEPDLSTARRVAEAIEAALGQGTAEVWDPGAVRLRLESLAERGAARLLADIGDLTVQAEQPARVVVDARNGTVVAGGQVRVGEAVVSHGGLTLAVGGVGREGFAMPGELRLQPGVSVQEVATALHAVAAPPAAIAAVFQALRDVGALRAQVVVR